MSSLSDTAWRMGPASLTVYPTGIQPPGGSGLGLVCAPLGAQSPERGFSTSALLMFWTRDVFVTGRIFKGILVPYSLYFIGYACPPKS